jgi:hypothetical protein
MMLLSLLVTLFPDPPTMVLCHVLEMLLFYKGEKKKPEKGRKGSKSMKQSIKNQESDVKARTKEMNT